MDAGRTSTRLFPSYTTAEIAAWLETETDPAKRAKFQAALDQRAAGNKSFATPQIEGGKPQPKIGRL